VDIKYDPVSNTVRHVAEFGPLSNPVGYLKLILSVAKGAQQFGILTVTQSRALSSIVRECQQELTKTYSEHSRAGS
jgi:hypothetical protein